MRGLWLEDRQLRLREDLPVPVPGPGEALVRVRLAGICATDLELRQGYYPFAGIPGHEFVGEIAACARPARTPGGTGRWRDQPALRPLRPLPGRAGSSLRPAPGAGHQGP
jgi:hypothetical protein